MNTQLQNTQNTQATEGTEPSFVVPPVDVFEDASGITVMADLPGVSRDRLAVRVDGETLTLEASAQTDAPERMTLIHNEAPHPSYRRSFALSRELDASRIDASLKDGVLRLVIPKREEARPRRVEVRVS